MFVTEYLNEADYFKKRILEDSRPIENELKLKSYINDIAEALNHIHSKGYVHCDVRLENLYCARGGLDLIRTVLDITILNKVKLGGLDLAQPTGTPLTAPLKKMLSER